jgi:c-di-GMP phosphodiesterase
MTTPYVGTGADGASGAVATGAATTGPDRRGGQAGLVRYVRVGRQGIYDASRRLVAYELLFRAHDRAVDNEVAGEQATSQVIASTFGTFGLDNISDGKPLFINFTRAFLTGIIPIPVEPERVVIEVVEHVAVDRELLMGLRTLKDEGYRIAVDDYDGDVDRSALLDVADYVKIDVNSVQPLMLPGLVAAGRNAGAVMVAEAVEDAESWRRCSELGFELYQGFHLSRPMVLEQRSLSPSQLICVRLLNDLGDPETPIARIEQMVGTDPGLTMRLLRTANSASTGATREVASLRQALVIIGPRRLRSWVVLTLLEGGTTTNSSDDLWAVLARAHACQRLAGTDEDLAFTVGLLSGAAELLGVDASMVADASGVGPEARSALLDGAGPAGRVLLAVLAHERDDAEAITAAGLVPFDVSRAYLEALSESLQLVHDLTGHH